MKAILAQLIFNALDESKIPTLDYFDKVELKDGIFHIVLDDGTIIKVETSRVK